MAIEALDCQKLKSLIDFNNKLEEAADGLSQRPTNQQLIDFGHEIFDFTLKAEVRKIYDKLPGSHIRLQIYSNRPDLQALPWEYMQDPGKPYRFMRPGTNVRGKA